MTNREYAASLLVEAAGILNEARTAEEYNATKQKNANDKHRADEEAYQKRYGDATSKTILNNKLPYTKYDQYTHGSVSHDRVKGSKNMSVDKKIAHYEKMNKGRDKANLAIAKEMNRREQARNWGDNSLARDASMGNVARSADAIHRHNRRHPDRQVESVSFEMLEN